MDAKRFDEILHKTVSSTVKTLASKAKEYTKGDRLYNFKRAAGIQETTPEKALLGMWSKHLVSILDLIEGTLPATEAILNEKIGDTINYLILLKALLIEQHIPTYNGSITSATLFNEPTSTAPSAEIRGVLEKINEQAIQEKTGYATLARCSDMAYNTVVDEPATGPVAFESMVKDGGVRPKNLATKRTRVDLT